MSVVINSYHSTGFTLVLGVSSHRTQNTDATNNIKSLNMCETKYRSCIHWKWSVAPSAWPQPPLLFQPRVRPFFPTSRFIKKKIMNPKNCIAIIYERIFSQEHLKVTMVRSISLKKTTHACTWALNVAPCFVFTSWTLADIPSAKLTKKDPVVVRAWHSLGPQCNEQNEPCTWAVCYSTVH